MRQTQHRFQQQIRMHGLWGRILGLKERDGSRVITDGDAQTQ